MSWLAFLSIFGMGIVKFLFTPTYAYSALDNPHHWEILVPMISGALFGFNLFYWFSEYFMDRAKNKRIRAIKAGKVKRKKNFTKLNKFIVRIKMSNAGLVLLSTIGLMFMSIPIGGVVLAKFYREKHIAYFLGMLTIILVAFALTFGNKYIFAS